MMRMHHKISFAKSTSTYFLIEMEALKKISTSIQHAQLVGLFFRNNYRNGINDFLLKYLLLR